MLIRGIMVHVLIAIIANVLWHSFYFLWTGRYEFRLRHLGLAASMIFCSAIYGYLLALKQWDRCEQEYMAAQEGLNDVTKRA